MSVVRQFPQLTWATWLDTFSVTKAKTGKVSKQAVLCYEWILLQFMSAVPM